MFDNGTSEQTVHIIVYDDKILEAEEYFWLYFPSLTTNNDVHLIAETIPNRATVTIQDNEGNNNYAYESLLLVIHGMERTLL